VEGRRKIAAPFVAKPPRTFLELKNGAKMETVGLYTKGAGRIKCRQCAALHSALVRNAGTARWVSTINDSLSGREKNDLIVGDAARSGKRKRFPRLYWQDDQNILQALDRAERILDVQKVTELYNKIQY